MMRTNIRITKLMTRLTALEREHAEIIYCLVNSQGMAMADRQSTNRFGIDPAVLGQLDWALAKNRILADIRSDFIYAPHISNVFRHAADDLIAEVASELKSGRYGPGAPITIDVPKSARMHVVPQGSRGPTFSRPGSILLPKDRLVYQMLADQAAPFIETFTDRSRSFSHRLLQPSSADMFEPSRTCWNRMQQALNDLSKSQRQYVIKADVANCFASINQHILVNHLGSIGYPVTLKNALDALLVLNTGDRNSRGLLQGMFPSDLLGTFYLNPIDQRFRDLNYPSVRYVDDIYIFVPSLAAAEQITRDLTRILRDYDLSLNETKSKLLNSRSLIMEEPDLEKLFSDAVDELRDEDIDSDYGFQSEWDDEDDTDEDQRADIELGATISLFDSIDDFPAHVEKIERFYLPLFAAAESDHAVGHVISAFAQRPAMSQIYCSYLSPFLEDKSVRDSLRCLLTNTEVYYDWQRMWILAALMTPATSEDDIVSAALRIYRDGQRHEALRAVAAIFVAKHGTFIRQKELFDAYGISGSPYLQTSVLYGARYFQKDMRKAGIKSWASQSSTHLLVAKAIESLGR